MKTNKSTATHDVLQELKACEQIVACFGPEECELLTKVSNIEDERARIKSLHIATHPLYNEGGNEGARKKILQRLEAIDRDLPAMRRRLGEISGKIADAQKRIAGIKDEQRATARHAVESQLRNIVSSLPSRERYLAEKEKLGSLNGRLEEAKAELRRIQTASAGGKSDNERSMALVLTGELPEASAGKDSDQAVKRASGNISVILGAIEIQREALGKAKSEFVSDLNGGLKPLRESIIQRIADGYRHASEAATEAALMGDFVAREADSFMGFTGFYLVQPAEPQNNDPFSLWLKDRRREGYDV